MATVSAYLRNPSGFETTPEAPLATGREDARRSLWLTRGVFREFLAIEADLAPLMRRAPRPKIHALLLVAAYEIAQRGPDDRPPVVHFAVEACKHLGESARSGFVNAVLRRIAAMPPEAPADRARRCHPSWLTRRWEAAFGAEATNALLLWNQDPAPVYLHVRGDEPDPPGGETPWPGFRRIEGASRRDAALNLLASGRAYFQDPLTRHPAELLGSLSSPADVLDLCAAPGGKTWDLLRRFTENRGRFVMVDLPGPRFSRMCANAAAWKDPRVHCLAADATALDASTLEGTGLPRRFDVVLLDAPCSNTGVLRRRPDAKVRLARAGEKAVQAVVHTQARLLDKAVRLLRPGGRLVYSTCSLEAEENRAQIDALTQRQPAVRPLAEKESLPWRDGHDGGAAFLLTVAPPKNHS